MKKSETLPFLKMSPGDVPKIGLEPTYLAVPEPKSGVSANSTTWAMGFPKGLKFRRFRPFCQ
jgi:hypothetical protein